MLGIWFWFRVFGENHDSAEHLPALLHDADGRLITGPKTLVSTAFSRVWRYDQYIEI